MGQKDPKDCRVDGALDLVYFLSSMEAAVAPSGNGDVDTGLIVVESAQDVAATANKFIAAAKQSGLTIFGQRDNSKASEGPDRPKPAILVIFGNPNLLARLITVNPEIGLDLPMRLLVWESADGRVKVTYSDPRWLFERYGMPEQYGEISNKIGAVLDRLVTSACSASTQH